MLQLKNHALTRGKLAEGGLNSLAQNLPIQFLGGIRKCPIIGHRGQYINLIARVIEHHGLILAAGLAPRFSRAGSGEVEQLRFIFWELLKILGVAFTSLSAAKAVASRKAAGDNSLASRLARAKPWLHLSDTLK